MLVQRPKHVGHFLLLSHAISAELIGTEAAGLLLVPIWNASIKGSGLTCISHI